MNTNNPGLIFSGLRKALVAASTVLLVATPVLQAAELALTDTPLYLSSGADPNLILTFDDSGSMTRGYIPENLDDAYNATTNPAGEAYNHARGCSSTVNKLYYDPSITYTPPPNTDGTARANASFASALKDGFDSGSTAVDLNNYRPLWTGYGTSYATCGTTTGSGVKAFYFKYNGSGSLDSDASYTKITIPATEETNFANWYSFYRTRSLAARSAVARAFRDMPSNVRVAGQHLNNTSAGSGATAKFTKTIGNGALKPFTTANRQTFLTKLYNAPENGFTPLRSAMTRAGEYYGSESTTNGAYREDPSAAETTSNPEYGCRQNFHVLMTDGYWNNDDIAIGNLDGTITTLPDGNSYSLVAPAKYPYYDQWPGTATGQTTLADIAFKYWSTDLRGPATTSSDVLENNVQSFYTVKTTSSTDDYWNAKNDPATWQHMVNFTIGLGVDGSIPYTDANYNALVAGTTTWGDPTCGGSTGVCDIPERIDDLWHAAINSRGRYFSSSNASQLVNAFTSIVSSVADRVSSASAVAINASSLSGTKYVYQARYNSANWTGQLLAYKIDLDTGNVASTESWDAAEKLAGKNYASRTIVSFDPTLKKGIPFEWASLDTTTQTGLLNTNPDTSAADTQGQDRLEYIRGNAKHEGTGNNYRVRTRDCGLTTCPSGTNTGVLGDLVNSAPYFVGRPYFDYPDTIESAKYSKFASDNAGRKEVIYVGANDGMLHAFDANDGNELLAYVPDSVYKNLPKLTSTSYAHKFYVDGDVAMSDVFIVPKGGSTKEWRTILVGSLRKGGQGIFALDITDPSKFTQANADSLVLWEFSDKNDKDMGYSFSRPTVAKMHNNEWAVIFGNGYNNTETADGTYSTTGSAVLYILFIEKGKDGWASTDFVKIDTGVGSATTPNGLATPSVVDVDGDYVADYIYAGDLLGNMWKFDVRDTSASAWDGTTKRKIIYTAMDASNKAQPITTRPMVATHPAGKNGMMVYFGTGKYLEKADASSTGATTQTFYGIWDESDVKNPGRSDLLKQTIEVTVTQSGTEYRVVSNNQMIWRDGTPAPNPSYIGWYLDLPTTGEKQITNSILRSGNIIFTTLIPSDDKCKSGGEGWIMELRAENGGRPDSSIFDVNGDDTISTADLIGIGSGSSATQATASGQKIGGVPSAPTILTGGPATGSTPGGCGGKECKYISSSDGSIKRILEQPNDCNFCRKSWTQLR